MLRAVALDRLRKKLSGWCTEAGLAKAPLLAFERWRFAAKWREEEEELRLLKLQQQDGGGKGKKPGGGGGGGAKAVSLPSDPVLPSAVAGSSDAKAAAAPSSAKWVKGEAKKTAPPPSSSSDPGEGLARDLVQAGMMPASAAVAIAEKLAAASHEIAATVAKRAHQLASGRPAGKGAAAVVASFHRRTVDLTAGGGHFVKVNRDAYCRLAKMYRRNHPASDAAPPALPLPSSAAPTAECAEVAEDDAAEAAEAARLADMKGGGDVEATTGSGTGSYRAFHNRLFALLLRYKSIQGHGYQASSYCRPASIYCRPASSYCHRSPQPILLIVAD